jgi:hypothetical protein
MVVDALDEYDNGNDNDNNMNGVVAVLAQTQDVESVGTL